MADEDSEKAANAPLKPKKRRSSRGEPLAYGELKQRTNFTLTPFTRKWLKQLAKAENCSMSELLERWARNQLRVNVDFYRDSN